MVDLEQLRDSIAEHYVTTHDAHRVLFDFLIALDDTVRDTEAPPNISVDQLRYRHVLLGGKLPPGSFSMHVQVHAEQVTKEVSKCAQ